MSKIMGIDYGQKRIGVALSDELQMFASPYSTIINTNREEIILKLTEIIQKEGVIKIVVGVPYYLDGTSSKQTEEVLRFIRHLKNNLTLPIETFDERYSSSEARDILNKKKKTVKESKENIDQIAAAIILQNYLHSEDKGK
ncbi:MAG: Holliday junction resolvase RuvX [Candidatus Cloacimonetes bacterium]|nr:Holliday junction resolvase RuvX [Candidatus Cloacimonadota bacterium]